MVLAGRTKVRIWSSVNGGLASQSIERRDAFAMLRQHGNIKPTWQIEKSLRQHVCEMLKDFTAHWSDSRRYNDQAQARASSHVACSGLLCELLA